jgi:hypothetical protein
MTCANPLAAFMVGSHLHRWCRQEITIREQDGITEDRALRHLSGSGYQMVFFMRIATLMLLKARSRELERISKKATTKLSVDEEVALVIRRRKLARLWEVEHFVSGVLGMGTADDKEVLRKIQQFGDANVYEQAVKTIPPKRFVITACDDIDINAMMREQALVLGPLSDQATSARRAIENRDTGLLTRGFARHARKAYIELKKMHAEQIKEAAKNKRIAMGIFEPLPSEVDDDEVEEPPKRKKIAVSSKKRNKTADSTLDGGQDEGADTVQPDINGPESENGDAASADAMGLWELEYEDYELEGTDLPNRQMSSTELVSKRVDSICSLTVEAWKPSFRGVLAAPLETHSEFVAPETVAALLGKSMGSEGKGSTESDREDAQVLGSKTGAMTPRVYCNLYKYYTSTVADAVRRLSALIADIGITIPIEFEFPQLFIDKNVMKLATSPSFTAAAADSIGDSLSVQQRSVSDVAGNIVDSAVGKTSDQVSAGAERSGLREGLDENSSEMADESDRGACVSQWIIDSAHKRPVQKIITKTKAWPWFPPNWWRADRLLTLLQNDMKNLDDRIGAEESKTSALLADKNELLVQLNELKTFLAQSRQGIFNVGAKAKKETKNFLKQKGLKSKFVEGAINESAVVSQKAAALCSIIKDARTLAQSGHFEVAAVTLGGDASMLAPASGDKEKASALIMEAITQKELELAAAKEAANQAKESADALQNDLDKFLRQRDFLQSSLNRMIMDRFDTTVNATRYFEDQAKVLDSYKRLEAEYTWRTRAMKKEKAFLEKMIKDFSDRALDLQVRVSRYSMRVSISGGNRGSVRSRGRSIRQVSSAPARSRVLSSRRTAFAKNHRRKSVLDEGHWIPIGPEVQEDNSVRPSPTLDPRGDWGFDGARTLEDADLPHVRPRPLEGTPEHPEWMDNLHDQDKEDDLTDDLSEVDEVRREDEEIRPDYFPMEEGEDPAVLYEEMSTSDADDNNPLKSDDTIHSEASFSPDRIDRGSSMHSIDSSLGVGPPHPPAPIDLSAAVSTPGRKSSSADLGSPKSTRSMSMKSESAHSRPPSSAKRFSMSARRSSIYEFAKSLMEKDNVLFTHTDLSSIDEEGNSRVDSNDIDIENSLFGNEDGEGSTSLGRFATEKLIKREMIEEQRLRSTFGKVVEPAPLEETR